jgi:hypothetical protein
MMVFRRFVVVAALSMIALGTNAAPVRAPDLPAPPFEQQTRLRELEGQVVDKQRELSAARIRNDDKEVERLGKEFKTLQDERLELLRATGRLP